MAVLGMGAISRNAIDSIVRAAGRHQIRELSGNFSESASYYEVPRKRLGNPSSTERLPVNENVRIVIRQWALAQPVVASFIAAVVRDFSDRDDVLQETAVAVLESADRYDSGRPFVAWALGIARNQVRMYLRRDSQQRLVFDDTVISQLADSFGVVSSDDVHRLGFLRDCLQRLDPRDQQLFQMRYAEDLKPAAIGERLGIAANTVSKALQRMRDQLRECIDRAAVSARAVEGHRT